MHSDYVNTLAVYQNKSKENKKSQPFGLFPGSYAKKETTEREKRKKYKEVVVSAKKEKEKSIFAFLRLFSLHDLVRQDT